MNGKHIMRNLPRLIPLLKKNYIALYNPEASSTLAKAIPPPPFQVTLPHGSTEQAPSNATSPRQTKVIAEKESNTAMTR